MTSRPVAADRAPYRKALHGDIWPWRGEFQSMRRRDSVSYTHLDVYKRQGNSALQLAVTQPEDHTPATAVAEGHFVQIGMWLPMWPCRLGAMR